MKNDSELIKSLKEEREQLSKQLHKLERFLSSDDLNKIDKESRGLLWEQWADMSAYERTLYKRIALAKSMKNREDTTK